MPLDHYVSQVHLKNFYSPSLGEAFYCIRKSELKIFHQSSVAVCRIESNSTNSYLTEDRVVEEFLKGIEPKYNVAVERLLSGSIDPDTIYTIAGFVAYIITCSPASMRIHSAPLQEVTEATAVLLDKMGDLPVPPDSLKGQSFSDLIESGKVKFEIDPKYPQAIGISNILNSIKVLGNSTWEILENRFRDNPFFTSDYPVVIEQDKSLPVLNKVIPLTPFLAVRICPDITLDKNEMDFDFSNFRFLRRKLSKLEVRVVNRGIIRCAESIVFFRENFPWVERFVKNNSDYRIEPIVNRVPHGKGSLLIASQKIVPF